MDQKLTFTYTGGCGKNIWVQSTFEKNSNFDVSIALMKNSWQCRPVSVVKVDATVGAKASQLSVLHFCVCVNNMFARKANPSNRANSISLHRTSTCVYAHKWVSGGCQCVCTVHLSMGKWIKKKSAYYKGIKKCQQAIFLNPAIFLGLFWPILDFFLHSKVTAEIFHVPSLFSFKVSAGKDPLFLIYCVVDGFHSV